MNWKALKEKNHSNASRRQTEHWNQIKSLAPLYKPLSSILCLPPSLTHFFHQTTAEVVLNSAQLNLRQPVKLGYMITSRYCLSLDGWADERVASCDAHLLVHSSHTTARILNNMPQSYISLHWYFYILGWKPAKSWSSSYEHIEDYIVEPKIQLYQAQPNL